MRIMYQIIAQGFGIAASLLIIFSFQMKDNRRLFVCHGLGGLLFAVNFFMLGAYTGAILNILSFLRGTCLYFGGKWCKQWSCILFCVLFVTVGVFTCATSEHIYDSILSALIAVAMIAVTIAMWARNGKNIRLANFFVSSPTWLAYNIYHFSIGGIITEVFSIISVMISFIRFGFNGFSDSGKKEK